MGLDNDDVGIEPTHVLLWGLVSVGDVNSCVLAVFSGSSCVQLSLNCVKYTQRYLLISSLATYLIHNNPPAQKTSLLFGTVVSELWAAVPFCRGFDLI